MATAVLAAPTKKASRPIPPLPVKQFTLEEYHRLAEIGVLRESERVELLTGWIVPKMTVHPPHSSALTRLQKRLGRLLAEDWVLRIQQPVTLARWDSEPEPDAAVAAGPEDRYDGAHPGPKDIRLVVEVAESSLAEDQGIKLEIYAAARLPVYWIVNLVDRRVEVYTQPRGGKNPAYRQRADYGPADAVPVVIDGQQAGTIPVRELLP
jgi:hypothetical protein